MAVTNERSNVFTNLVALPFVMSPRAGDPYWVDWAHTQGVAAGDANSTIEVYRIPAGGTVDLALSPIVFTAYGAARVLSFGYRAYTEQDGTAIAVALTGLFSGLDVSAAGFRHMGEAPTIPATALRGRRTFKGTADLVLQVTGGTIPAGAVTYGRLCIWPQGT